MILTEEEARKMWCCGGMNNPSESIRCMTLACMAWRWFYEKQEIHGMVIETRTEKGYCGLAGKPDG
jgi:hypothetical protein